jgi:hypothetical protein
VAVLPQRMMYVGQLRPGSTSEQRAQAIREPGIEMDAVDTHPETIRIRESAFVERVRRRLFGTREPRGVPFLGLEVEF